MCPVGQRFKNRSFVWMHTWPGWLRAALENLTPRCKLSPIVTLQVVRNSDELFEREEFSAAPDVGWPDCFNSGVFVFRPSVETFNNLIQFAVEKGSFDGGCWSSFSRVINLIVLFLGGDQGLLNHFFNTWATDDIRKHLPFVYNLTSVAVYSYIPAFKQ